MRAHVFALLLLAGCTSDRDRDCERAGAAIRAVYPTGDVTVIDERALDALRAMSFRDPEVAAAVKELTDSAWTAYTPYTTDSRPLGTARLRALCNK